MALAIVSFSLQMFFLILTEALSLTGRLTETVSWVIIVMFVACLIMSSISIKLSANEKNYGSKGKGVTGIVFGIVGTVFTAIFLTVVFVIMLAYI